MIRGVVSTELEASLRLTVLSSNQQRSEEIDAIIDTGFSGFLTLKPSLIMSLNLGWLGREPGILADGSVELFDVYRGTIVWDGHVRAVEIEAADIESLVGMALLRGHEVRIHVKPGGEVLIAPVPDS